MLLDRRLFAAGSLTLLSGCATVGTGRISGCTPLARVLAAESRVIRTMAGLRPYRRSLDYLGRWDGRRTAGESTPPTRRTA